MKHLAAISLEKAVCPEKALDSGAAIFLQIWAAVFSAILMGAFGQKH